jgi:Tfp pilus assembly protein PilF
MGAAFLPIPITEVHLKQNLKPSDSTVVAWLAAAVFVLSLLACASLQSSRPADPAEARTRAMAACERRRDAKCVERLRPAQALSPRDADLALRLAWAEFEIGELDRALAMADWTLEIDPREYRAHGLRGRVFIARHQFADAILAY